jgi:outer membrane autotransporter protein
MSHPSKLALLIACLLQAGVAVAANAPFQTFFFAACVNPIAALAQRCADTQNAQGDLSGDSESSLNPSQALGHGRVQIDGVRAREDGIQGEVATLDAGPFALRLTLRGSGFERRRGTSLAEERGLDGDARGGDLGLDYRLSERTVVGAVLGIDRSDYDFAAEAAGVNFTPQARAGAAAVDQTMLSLFASHAIGETAYVDLSAGHGRTEGSYRRTSVFQESTRTVAQTNTNLRGRADGSLRWLSIDAGRDFLREALTFGVYGGATWARSTIDSYSEQDVSGSGLAMRFEGLERGSLLGVVGARLSYTFSTGAGVILPQLQAQWQNEFDDDPETLDASFLLDADATRFRLQGDRPDRTSGEVGVSLAAVFSNGWSAFFDYTRLVARDDFDRDLFSAGLRREF